MSAPKLSTFEIKRAKNMAVNSAALAAIAPLPVAAAKPGTVVKKKTAVKQIVTATEPRKRSERLAVIPKRSYAEVELFPALPLERTTKKTKKEDGSNIACDKKKEKKDGGDDSKKKDDTKESVDGDGPTKAKRPAYKDRPECSMNSVTISESDLALVRDDYALFRLPGFKVDGEHPEAFSAVKKVCRITNWEFDRLNVLRKGRKEKELVKARKDDSAWVAASITASERFEKVMAEMVKKAKEKVAKASK